MLELYWAEACELDPPSEGVGYGDLEASMAMSGSGWAVGIGFVVSVSVTAQGGISVGGRAVGVCSYTHAGAPVREEMGRSVGEADGRRAWQQTSRGGLVDVVQAGRGRCSCNVQRAGRVYWTGGSSSSTRQYSSGLCPRHRGSVAVSWGRVARAAARQRRRGGFGDRRWWLAMGIL
jgi:hypothetical protein